MKKYEILIYLNKYIQGCEETIEYFEERIKHLKNGYMWNMQKQEYYKSSNPEDVKIEINLCKDKLQFYKQEKQTVRIIRGNIFNIR